MLQALNEDMSHSEWSMLLKGLQRSSCTGVARHADSLLAHPLCWLRSLISVQTGQTRPKGPRWVLGWCLSPTHSSCLLEWPQVVYHALYICCSFSVFLWYKVPVLQARMGWGGVTPWWRELFLFGVGVALGPWDGTNGQLFTLNLWLLQASWSFVLCTSLLVCCFIFFSPFFFFFRLRAQCCCRCQKQHLSTPLLLKLLLGQFQLWQVQKILWPIWLYETHKLKQTHYVSRFTTQHRLPRKTVSFTAAAQCFLQRKRGCSGFQHCWGWCMRKKQRSSFRFRLLNSYEQELHWQPYRFSEGDGTRTSL